jgi:hypothetical protein
MRTIYYSVFHPFSGEYGYTIPKGMDAFNEKVQGLLDEGWTLYGSPSPVIRGDSMLGMIQAFTKQVDSTVDVRIVDEDK